MTDKQKAIIRYNESGIEKEEQSPLERLRFFCSLAMSGDDWLDAEMFFDSLALQVRDKVDVGPWSAGATSGGRAYLESNDFVHDVRLYIDGDFAWPGDNLSYAEGIARQLNAAPVSAEPEPVAWACNPYTVKHTHSLDLLWTKEGERAIESGVIRNGTRLYAAPVAAQADTGVSILQMATAFGKFVAGYRPGEEAWSDRDQEAYDAAMGCTAGIAQAQQPVSGTDQFRDAAQMIEPSGNSGELHASFESWRKSELPWTSPATPGIGFAWDAWRARAALAQQDADKVNGALAEMVHAMFRSSNSIPVTRITIDRKQYEAAIESARKEQE